MQRGVDPNFGKRWRERMQSQKAPEHRCPDVWVWSSVAFILGVLTAASLAELLLFSHLVR
jgi:hypothetical protein